MFGKVASFEFRYQLRQPVFWVVAGVFFLFTFGLTTVQNISIGLGPSDHRNGPYAIALTYLIWTVFYMFVTTAFVANVIVRDHETGFGPIVRATRISKFDYLIGRFTGAYAAAAVSFLAIPVAILLGSVMWWVDPELIGPTRLWPFLYLYLVIALPGLLLTSAVFFALATLTRSMMATYLGVAGFLVIWLVSQILVRDLSFERTIAVLEPFGLGAYGLVSKYWTAAERNSLLPPLADVLLWNRLLVLGVSALALLVAYAVFRFEERPAKARKRDRLRAQAEAGSAPAGLPAPVQPRFDAGTAFAQLIARTRLDMRQVFLSPAFLVLMVLGLINSIASLWTLDEIYGVGIHPVTRVIIRQLDGAFAFFPLIIAIYYSGDLVWRERDRRTHEIVDAAPIPDWAYVAPKTLAITLVLVSAFVISVVAGVGVQALKGYTHFELGKYLLWYLVPNSVDMFLFAALAVFCQAVSPHKFIGWGLMVVYIISLFALPGLGLEHNLYRYAGAPDSPLSDMVGLGKFWTGGVWFRLYWSAFALILLIVAYGLWRRGTETRMAPRLRRFPARLKGGAGVLLAVAVLVFIGSGAFIFLNTNIWNQYRTRQDNERWLANLEKTLIQARHFDRQPQPSIVDVKLDVDVQPNVPRVTTRGVYVIENKTGAPLREIHVRFPRDLVMRGLSIEGAWPKTTAFDQFNYRIFSFDTPMQPGERRKMAFETVLTQHGFKNNGDLRQVNPNGTFTTDRDIAPTIGIERDGLLQDRAKRAKYGLPRELRMPKLGEPGADRFNYLGHDSDWVTSDIRVTTDAGQTPIAPGTKVSDVTRGGRRTAEFKTEAPILRFFSIQSARYLQKTETYKGIQLTVYYDAQHPWNVDRMMGSMKASLDYFQANFSPYQFHQVRFLEFPDYAQFAESFAGTIPWSEGLGFITDVPKDASKIDYVTYVGAHEIGHQWWAHQVIGADEQGSTSLSETLAQYSALMVMKHMYGPDMIRRFLKFELDRYLSARGGDPLPEEPLERVENQAYIHYRKGSLVMYRLQDEIGEDAVNRALRHVLAQYAFKGPPYPTSLDLVKAIRAEAPADKQGLITDLFEKITLYDIKTSKVAVSRRRDGKFDVVLTVSARKLYADGRGKETEAPMNETLDVGLFTAEPGKAGFSAAKVISMQRLPIHTGVQTLRLVSILAPKFAGADPYNKLIDRNADDNVKAVGG